MNKTDVNKLLVAERKAMREKQKNSIFMRRTLSIYNGMKKRAAECKCSLNFSLDEFRKYVDGAIGGPCPYCKEVIKVSNFTPDHSYPVSRGGSFVLANLEICDKSCNWQKGALTENEFLLLLGLIEGFEKEAQADVKRRLTIGGRWSWK